MAASRISVINKINEVQNRKQTVMTASGPRDTSSLCNMSPFRKYRCFNDNPSFERVMKNAILQGAITREEADAFRDEYTKALGQKVYSDAVGFDIYSLNGNADIDVASLNSYDAPSFSHAYRELLIYRMMEQFDKVYRPEYIKAYKHFDGESELGSNFTSDDFLIQGDPLSHKQKMIYRNDICDRILRKVKNYNSELVVAKSRGLRLEDTFKSVYDEDVIMDAFFESTFAGSFEKNMKAETESGVTYFESIKARDWSADSEFRRNFINRIKNWTLDNSAIRPENGMALAVSPCDPYFVSQFEFAQHEKLGIVFIRPGNEGDFEVFLNRDQVRNEATVRACPIKGVLPLDSYAVARALHTDISQDLPEIPSGKEARIEYLRNLADREVGIETGSNTVTTSSIAKEIDKHSIISCDLFPDPMSYIRKYFRSDNEARELSQFFLSHKTHDRAQLQSQMGLNDDFGNGSNNDIDGLSDDDEFGGEPVGEVVGNLTSEKKATNNGFPIYMSDAEVIDQYEFMGDVCRYLEEKGLRYEFRVNNKYDSVDVRVIDSGISVRVLDYRSPRNRGAIYDHGVEARLSLNNDDIGQTDGSEGGSMIKDGDEEYTINEYFDKHYPNSAAFNMVKYYFGDTANVLRDTGELADTRIGEYAVINNKVDGKTVKINTVNVATNTTSHNDDNTVFLCRKVLNTTNGKSLVAVARMTYTRTVSSRYSLSLESRFNKKVMKDNPSSFDISIAPTAAFPDYTKSLSNTWNLTRSLLSDVKVGDDGRIEESQYKYRHMLLSEDVYSASDDFGAIRADFQKALDNYPNQSRNKNDPDALAREIAKRDWLVNYDSMTSFLENSRLSDKEDVDGKKFTATIDPDGRISYIFRAATQEPEVRSGYLLKLSARNHGNYYLNALRCNAVNDLIDSAKENHAKLVDVEGIIEEYERQTKEIEDSESKRKSYEDILIDHADKNVDMLRKEIWSLLTDPDSNVTPDDVRAYYKTWSDVVIGRNIDIDRPEGTTALGGVPKQYSKNHKFSVLYVSKYAVTDFMGPNINSNKRVLRNCLRELCHDPSTGISIDVIQSEKVFDYETFKRNRDISVKNKMDVIDVSTESSQDMSEDAINLLLEDEELAPVDDSTVSTLEDVDQRSDSDISANDASAVITDSKSMKNELIPFGTEPIVTVDVHNWMNVIKKNPESMKLFTRYCLESYNRILGEEICKVFGGKRNGDLHRRINNVISRTARRSDRIEELIDSLKDVPDIKKRHISVDQIRDNIVSIFDDLGANEVHCRNHAQKMTTRTGDEEFDKKYLGKYSAPMIVTVNGRAVLKDGHVVFADSKDGAHVPNEVKRKIYNNAARLYIQACAEADPSSDNADVPRLPEFADRPVMSVMVASAMKTLIETGVDYNLFQYDWEKPDDKTMRVSLDGRGLLKYDGCIHTSKSDPNVVGNVSGVIGQIKDVGEFGEIDLSDINGKILIPGYDADFAGYDSLNPELGDERFRVYGYVSKMKDRISNLLRKSILRNPDEYEFDTHTTSLNSVYSHLYGSRFDPEEFRDLTAPDVLRTSSRWVDTCERNDKLIKTLSKTARLPTATIQTNTTHTDSSLMSPYGDGANMVDEAAVNRYGSNLRGLPSDLTHGTSSVSEDLVSHAIVDSKYTATASNFGIVVAGTAGSKFDENSHTVVPSADPNDTCELLKDENLGMATKLDSVDRSNMAHAHAKDTLFVMKHVNVAYITFNGYNMDDGVLITRPMVEQMANISIDKPDYLSDEQMQALSHGDIAYDELGRIIRYDSQFDKYYRSVDINDKQSDSHGNKGTYSKVLDDRYCVTALNQVLHESDDEIKKNNDILLSITSEDGSKRNLTLSQFLSEDNEIFGGKERISVNFYLYNKDHNKELSCNITSDMSADMRREAIIAATQKYYNVDNKGLEFLWEQRKYNGGKPFAGIILTPYSIMSRVNVGSIAEGMGYDDVNATPKGEEIVEPPMGEGAYVMGIPDPSGNGEVHMIKCGFVDINILNKLSDDKTHKYDEKGTGRSIGSMGAEVFRAAEAKETLRYLFGEHDREYSSMRMHALAAGADIDERLVPCLGYHKQANESIPEIDVMDLDGVCLTSYDTLRGNKSSRIKETIVKDNTIKDVSFDKGFIDFADGGFMKLPFTLDYKTIERAYGNNVDLFKTEMSAFISNDEIKSLLSNGNTTAIGKNGENLMFVLPQSERASTDYGDGSEIINTDYTREYINIYQNASYYSYFEKCQKCLRELNLDESPLPSWLGVTKTNENDMIKQFRKEANSNEEKVAKKLKAWKQTVVNDYIGWLGTAMDQCKSDAQAAMDTLLDKLIERKFESKQSDMHACVLAKKLGPTRNGIARSMTANMGPDNNRRLDEIGMSMKTAETLGLYKNGVPVSPSGRAEDIRVLIDRDPLLNRGNFRYMKVVIDNTIPNGISINPVAAKSLDGDFDGDTIGVFNMMLDEDGNISPQNIKVHEELKHIFGQENNMLSMGIPSAPSDYNIDNMDNIRRKFGEETVERIKNSVSKNDGDGIYSYTYDQKHSYVLNANTLQKAGVNQNVSIPSGSDLSVKAESMLPLYYNISQECVVAMYYDDSLADEYKALTIEANNLYWEEVQYKTWRETGAIDVKQGDPNDKLILGEFDKAKAELFEKVNSFAQRSMENTVGISYIDFTSPDTVFSSMDKLWSTGGKGNADKFAEIATKMGYVYETETGADGKQHYKQGSAKRVEFPRLDRDKVDEVTADDDSVRRNTARRADLTSAGGHERQVLMITFGCTKPIVLDACLESSAVTTQAILDAKKKKTDAENVDKAITNTAPHVNSGHMITNMDPDLGTDKLRSLPHDALYIRESKAETYEKLHHGATMDCSASAARRRSRKDKKALGQGLDHFSLPFKGATSSSDGSRTVAHFGVPLPRGKKVTESVLAKWREINLKEHERAVPLKVDVKGFIKNKKALCALYNQRPSDAIIKTIGYAMTDPATGRFMGTDEYGEKYGALHAKLAYGSHSFREFVKAAVDGHKSIMDGVNLAAFPDDVRKQSEKWLHGDNSVKFTKEVMAYCEIRSHYAWNADFGVLDMVPDKVIARAKASVSNPDAVVPMGPRNLSRNAEEIAKKVSVQADVDTIDSVSAPSDGYDGMFDRLAEIADTLNIGSNSRTLIEQTADDDVIDIDRVLKDGSEREKRILEKICECRAQIMAYDKIKNVSGSGNGQGAELSIDMSAQAPDLTDTKTVSDGGHGGIS